MKPKEKQFILVVFWFAVTVGVTVGVTKHLKKYKKVLTFTIKKIE